MAYARERSREPPVFVGPIGSRAADAVALVEVWAAARAAHRARGMGLLPPAALTAPARRRP